MSFSRNFKQSRINRKHCHSKSEIPSPLILEKGFPMQKKSNFPSQPKPKKSDYCDLSIVITNDDNSSDKYSNLSSIEIIKSAKQSLIELQQEAKNCTDSSQKLISDAVKKLKSSCLTIDSQSRSNSAFQNTRDMLDSLSKSVHELNERISINEGLMQVHVEENSTLRFELKQIEENFKVQDPCKIENVPITIGCACILM